MYKIMNVFSKLLISFMLVAVLTVTASAAIGYTAIPKLPGNQRPDVSAYFDLDTQPGLTQDLSVKVLNDGDEEITIEVEAYAASTNRNGEVVYVPVENLGTTPKHLIPDMVQIPEKLVTIPAKSEKDIIFTLNVPDDPFDGIVLGSIRVLKTLSDAEANAGGIVNQYAYSIPIRLHQSDAEIAPDFRLDSVDAQLVNFSASIICKIVNPQPKLIKGMTVTTEIYPEGSDMPILEYTNENVSMAPESLMPLTIKEQFDKGFTGGKYIAKINMQYEGKEWNLEENFEITVEKAATINDGIIAKDAPPAIDLPLWAIILIIAGAVIILAVVIGLIVSRKHIKKYKEMTAKLEAIVDNQTSTHSNVGENIKRDDVGNE